MKKIMQLSLIIGAILVTSNIQAQEVLLSDGALKMYWAEQTSDFRQFFLMPTEINNGSYGYKFSWRNDDGSQRLDPLVFDVTGNTYFPDGKVGIGTFAPIAEFSLAGQMHIEDGNGAGVIYFGQGQGNLPNLYFRSGTPSNRTDRMFIDGINGNVGIGTTTPQEKLDVNGAVRAGRGIATADGETLLTLHSQRLWEFRQNGKGPNTQLELYNAINKNFIINTGGNVGIGTTTIPSGYKLAVDGKAITEEVMVELSQDWPDYVFQKDYQLMPLQKLEAAIQSQGHLPGIPSAAEVKEKGGFEVGDMQRRLLEKVEELTLYILQQQKKMTEMETEIDALKTRISNQ